MRGFESTLFLHDHASYAPAQSLCQSTHLLPHRRLCALGTLKHQFRPHQQHHHQRQPSVRSWHLAPASATRAWSVTQHTHRAPSVRSECETLRQPTIGSATHRTARHTALMSTSLSVTSARLRSRRLPATHTSLTLYQVLAKQYRISSVRHTRSSHLLVPRADIDEV